MLRICILLTLLDGRCSSIVIGVVIWIGTFEEDVCRNEERAGACDLAFNAAQQSNYIPTALAYTLLHWCLIVSYGTLQQRLATVAHTTKRCAISRTSFQSRPSLLPFASSAVHGVPRIHFKRSIGTIRSLLLGGEQSQGSSRTLYDWDVEAEACQSTWNSKIVRRIALIRKMTILYSGQMWSA
jgi:hypothetical protein